MFDALLANNAQITLGIVFGGVALVMLVEAFSPFRPLQADSLFRWLNNLGLATFDYLLLLGLSPVLAMSVISLIGRPEKGVLIFLEAGPWLSFLSIVLVLEFLSYWLHRAFHLIPWLWRIHAVHHSDTEVDATTAHRHHPFELFFSTLITVPVVVMLGAEPIMLFAYNVLRLSVAAFSHGNFSLPPALEVVLRRLIVTPDFHRMHHSAERRYTDSNYSGVLPLFDYLFRTATLKEQQQQRLMQLGLSEFRSPRDGRIDRLLIMPFLGAFNTHSE